MPKRKEPELRPALEAEGIVFIETDEMVGVALRGKPQGE